MTSSRYSSWKVLVTGPPLCSEAMKLLRTKSEVITIPPYSPSEKIAKVASGQKIDALIVRMGRVNRKVLAASPNLQVIVKHGTGVDNIDVLAATELGLPVLITSEANFQSVAEQTVGLIFAVVKELIYLDYRLRTGNWDKVGYKGKELYGKSLGLVGIGRVGRRVSELLAPLEMDRFGYDPYVSDEDFPKEVKHVDSLHGLLNKVDVISIHCPLTEETYHLIGENEFRMMKPTAYLINTARGGIVDEKALIRALKEGWIKGAALDTFEKEPPPIDNPLWKLTQNLVVTPHIAGVTNESFARVGIAVAEMALNVLEGKGIERKAVVNPSVL